MILFFIFLLLGLIFIGLYIFSRERFSPANLLLALWLAAMGIAQLQLSPYERAWPLNFWFLLFIFLAIFYLVYKIVSYKFGQKLAVTEISPAIQLKYPLIIFTVLTLITLVANFYIFNRFGTLPILSSVPDKLRFIINREVFGLWEYAALLPRLYLPFIFICLLIAKNLPLTKRLWLWFNLVLGFLFLGLYASRLVIILPILLSYFAYLYLKIKELNFKKIIISSLTALLLVAFIAVTIPALRNYITYQDYYSEIDYTPFTYLADLSSINLPANLSWLIPLYLIPSFNLQALMRAVDFYNLNNYYFGAYSLSAFDSLLNIFSLPGLGIVIPWETIFLPWWVTATFLFSSFVDFGYLGIILAAVGWGVILALIYQLATKKPTLLSVMLMSYLSFVVVMSIYTDYLLREEFYLDLIFIFLISLAVNSYSKNLPTILLPKRKS